MIKELIQTAKSVDLAIELGCENLGVPRDQAQFEILDLPKKKLFGLKITPAKVRVYVELPDKAPPKAAAQAPAQQRPAQQRPAQPKNRPQREAKPPAKERREDDAGKRHSQNEAPPQHKQPQQPEARQHEEPPVIIEPDSGMLAKAAAAVDYIKDILSHMGFDQVEVTPRFTQNGATFALSGADLGAVIGRRGETLDALQYLSGLVANRLEGDYLRVTIDSGNYRQKREKTLESLARKLALSAVRTGKSCTLEPMNPYERRIIHAAVSQIRGATSSSVGEEPNRRVVIKSATGQPRPGGDRDHRGKSRGGRPPRGGADKKPREPRQPSAVRQPETAAASQAEKAARLQDEGGPLYGKITLD